MRKYLLVITFTIFLLPFKKELFSQNPINVIESNLLEQLIINDTTHQKFSGNVIIEYSNFNITCDTVLIDDSRDLIRAWGNTSIFNDTINCQSDSVTIIQKLNQMVFFKNSVIETQEMQIRSHEIQYDFETKDISYIKGGKVKNEDYQIESKLFHHNTNNKISNFKEDVEIEGDDLRISGKNIIFSNDTIIFKGPTVIHNEELIINCINGYFKKSQKLELFDFVELNSNNQKIKAQYLNRNVKEDQNFFKKNIEIQVDTSTYIYGDQLNQINNQSSVTGNCIVVLYNNNDSTTISGDEINIDEKNDILEINNNIFMRGTNIAGKCEKMLFKNQYTTIQMISEPILWLDQSQLIGKEIILQTMNNNLDSLSIDKNPFIIYPNDSIPYYNQIKGKSLRGKFKKGQIEYINILGNGELKSFTLDDQTNKININNTKSSSIRLDFIKNDIKKVICRGGIESSSRDFKQNDPLLLDKKIIYLEDFDLKKR